MAKIKNVRAPVREWLEKQGACADSCNWVGTRTPKEAWRDCVQPSWLLWSALRIGVPDHMYRQMAIDSAKSVLHLIDDGKPRPLEDEDEGEPPPLRAIMAAEAWHKNPTETVPANVYAAVAHANMYALYAAQWTVPLEAARAAASAAETVTSQPLAGVHCLAAVRHSACALIAARQAPPGWSTTDQVICDMFKKVITCEVIDDLFGSLGGVTDR